MRIEERDEKRQTYNSITCPPEMPGCMLCTSSLPSQLPFMTTRLENLLLPLPRRTRRTRPRSSSSSRTRRSRLHPSALLSSPQTKPGEKSTHLPQLCQMDLQRLRIILKPQRSHRIQYILPANRLSFFYLTLLRRFGGDEGYEFGNAFLYAFFGVFCDFGG